MQVKPISAVSATDSVDLERLRSLVVSELSYGDLTSALAASDLPVRRTELSTEDAVELAVQGLSRVGLAGVREHNRRARNLNGRYQELAACNGGQVLVGSPVCKLLDKHFRELWGGVRRSSRCADLAWRIARQYRPGFAGQVA